MPVSFTQILVVLLMGIALIVVLTAKFRIHAFFALILACFVVGLGVQLTAAEVITAIKEVITLLQTTEKKVRKM